jgi:hypothetical protein
MKVHANDALLVVCGVAATVLIGSAMSLIDSRPASATPTYASQTGLACGRCHVNPAGGGALKPFGKTFQSNGHKLKK